MKPINFEECNAVFAENQPEYEALPAYKHNDEYGCVTSCWSLSISERIKLLFQGKIYVTLMTFGKPLTPQLLGLTFNKKGEKR